MRTHTIGLMIVLLATAAPAGCVVPLPVGDGRDDEGQEGSGGSDSTDSSGGGSGGATSGGPTGTSGSATDTPSTGDDAASTGVSGQCPVTPDFQCSIPVECGEPGCGGPFNHFDEDGCLRPSCLGPGDCEAGEVCFFPIDHGGCASSGVSCFEEDGTCQCASEPDCGGGYCMPEGEVPSASCTDQPDEGACLDAGCSTFETVTVITDTCECITGQPACLWFLDEGFGGADSPDYFWHEDTLTVAMFGVSWIEPPVGWRSCTEPGSPSACGCYEPFQAPMCP